MDVASCIWYGNVCVLNGVLVILNYKLWLKFSYMSNVSAALS
jgi:hypothetical protein